MDNKEYFVKEMMQNFPESSGCLLHEKGQRRRGKQGSE